MFRSLTKISHNWQHAGVVHLSLQADGKGDLEDIPVCGIYAAQPATNLSLYLFVVVDFLDAVVVSQVYVAFNIFYQNMVHVDGVLSTSISFIFVMFIFRPIDLTRFRFNKIAIQGTPQMAVD